MVTHSLSQLIRCRYRAAGAAKNVQNVKHLFVNIQTILPLPWLIEYCMEGKCIVTIQKDARKNFQWSTGVDFSYVSKIRIDRSPQFDFEVGKEC